MQYQENSLLVKSGKYNPSRQFHERLKLYLLRIVIISYYNFSTNNFVTIIIWELTGYSFSIPDAVFI